MTYLQSINRIIINELKKKTDFTIYGQNINKGSYITGLSRNIEEIKKSRVINTTNSEYSAIGMGFGIMMNGGNAVYFVKQSDFLLLGVDHFVNTLNLAKTLNGDLLKGSFTIVVYVCDHGLHGPQSSFNNMDDLSSLAQIDTFQINTLYEANKIIPSVFSSKGLNIISLGQRLNKRKIFSEKAVNASKNFSCFQYLKGSDTLFITSNFSFYYVTDYIFKNKISKQSSIININFTNSIDLNFLKRKIKSFKKIYMLSDAKSTNSRIYKICYLLNLKKANVKIIHRDKFGWHIQKDLFKFNF